MEQFIGILIRRERLRQNYSQEGLCRGICAVSYLSKIEQGKVQAGTDVVLSLIHICCDTNGMDMLTRLMYGGRVSLVIGFVVVFIETAIGIVLGGIAGYFGKWVDNLIMRIVDVFYCIPSMPIIIIIGSAMDGMQVDPQVRTMYLMLILGFLGWPGFARMIRGQILSLREQEFMTATEAVSYTHLDVYKRQPQRRHPHVE